MKECCSACGSTDLRSCSETVTVTHKGISGIANALYSECLQCGSEIVTDEQSKLNKRAVLRFKKECDGLLTGGEVAQIRERLSITQDEAALIFGGGPKAFSKYENDDVVQSAAMDKLLRLADEIPEVFSKLCEKSGVMVYESRVDWFGSSTQVKSPSKNDTDLTTSEYVRRSFHMRAQSISPIVHH